MPVIQPYKALALQLGCGAVNQYSVSDARLLIKKSINRTGSLIKSVKAFIGNDCKLVVLPEYFLTGFPMGESFAEWQQKACLKPGGEEYALLCKIALDNSIYLSGNVYELDDNFPQLYFQCSFIISPEGKIILRYKRLNSMYAPTPHDVLDKYIESYGKESLFPVIKTAIGNLACIASEEILYPEIARCLAMKGAEVFLHSSSETASPLPTQKSIARQARAIENMAYVVSANSAGINGISFPQHSTDAHSQIINYEGLKLCEAGYGETMVANATLHIDALRYHRQRPGMNNFLSRQRMELYADIYNQTVYPSNSLANKEPGREHFAETQLKVIERLKQKGVIE